MAEQEPQLKTENLTKDFGGLTAVHDVSLAVYPGEILGLIGPNGAGKTTLFNLIAGYYRPTAGHIYFNGQDITTLPPYKVCWKGIARTFQTPQPFNGLTVAQNILTARLFGGAKRESSRNVAEMAEFVGLGGKGDQLVDNLTAFDQKRVEIGKALACAPQLLLLDEVAAGLNLGERQELNALIERINQELGVSIVIIEHIMETIMLLSHRLMVLNNGEVLTSGEPARISKDPKVIEAYLGKEFVHRAEG